MTQNVQIEEYLNYYWIKLVFTVSYIFKILGKLKKFRFSKAKSGSAVKDFC
jgi:hypothetical protein